MTAKSFSIILLFPAFHAYTGLSKREKPSVLEGHKSMLQLMYTGQNFVISLQPRYLLISLTSKPICPELSCVPSQEKTMSCHGRAVWPTFKVGHGFRCLN